MTREGGSQARRLEIFIGGPERPFPLSARDADTLAMAVGAAIEEFQKESLRDGGEPEDPAVIEDFRALRERLYEHAGFGRLIAKRREKQ